MKPFAARFLSLLLVSGMIAVSAGAQAQDGTNEVALKRGVVTLSGRLEPAPVADTAGYPQLWLLKWKQPLTGVEAQRGLQVVDYMGGQVYSVLVRNRKAHQFLQTSLNLEGAARFPPDGKIDPSLPLAGSGTVTVAVSLVPGQEQQVRDALQNIGATGGANALLPENLLEVEVPVAQLGALARLPGVRSIGPVSLRVPLNRDERGYSGAAALSLPVGAGGKGLDGTGMVVGIGDNCPALGHVDTRDRNINFNQAAITNHATHVAGTVGGTGLIDPRARGMAPKSVLITHFFDAVWAKTPELLQGYGMTLTNNSYAAQVGNCGYAGTYDAYSAALDKMTVDYPSVLHVFASGNDGGNTCAPFTTGYGTVPGGYQPAKNILVVGNTAKDLSLWKTSSRGPVKDGRLKPEICAFGTDVYSCKPVNTYQLATGTSMASPSVTGAMTLLSQRYKTLHNGTTPPAVLLKALLVNGADDLGNSGPDYLYGFGMFNLTKAVTALEAGQYQAGAAAAGSNQSTSVTVPAGTAQLKVLLVWNDLPASAAASKALVNDLDLTVTDPSGITHKPLVLNPATPDAVAAEGTDRLNNIEQVVINAPAAGAYTLAVAGYSVTGGAQPYTVAYDFVPEGVRLLQPSGGVALPGSTAVNVYWEASPGTTSFIVEASTDNGATWTAVATPAPDARSAVWNTPAINSAVARVRVSRGTQVATSGTFVLNAVPQLQLDAQQCPGYVVVHWNAIAGATAYEMLRKIGPDLQPVDTVTSTSYAFSGLPLGDEQYVAVRPLIGGIGGYRSNAVLRVPNTGTGCGAFSNGDLMLERVVTPAVGRVATSTAFSSAQPLQIQVRNLGTTPISYYAVVYRLGGGAWMTSTQQPPLPAGAATIVGLSTANMTVPGAYTFQAAVVNTSSFDPVRANDSVVATFRQLPNAPVALATGAFETFEAVPRVALMQDTAGLFTDTRWDYSRTGTPYGRLRTFVDSTVTISGMQSLSLDADRNNPGTTNEVVGTYNLAGVTPGPTEVRLDWTYRLHGIPKTPAGNTVMVRGNDALPWVPLAVFDTATADGAARNSGSVSVSDALLSAGQPLSSSFSVRFRQEDTSVIAARNFGNGLTLDNIRLYSVVNDVVILGIDTPVAAACNLARPVPLRIRVANGTRTAQTAVPVSFRLDTNTIQTAVIPTLAAKDTIVFQFPQLLDASAPGPHRLDVWAAQPGDSYPGNDSLLRYAFRNQPLIDSFPHLQDFEASDGYWYAGGRNASWAWGTPAGAAIRSAASGTKAWKTGLTRGYNDNELSYLYSPCFNVSRLQAPMLSFSQAYQIENCGAVFCDAAWVEWSTDGSNWTKLGTAGAGFHWYDSLSYNAWTTETGTRWKVATMPLPAVTQPLQLRFVMQSDAGTVKDGLAVDDIHIYDQDLPVLLTGDARGSADVPAGTAYRPVQGSGALLAAFHPSGQALPGVTVTMYDHASFVDSSTARYLLPHSFSIHAEAAVEDSVGLRLYLPDLDMQRLLADTGCPECTRAPDVYRLGVLKYDDADKSVEDGTMQNNRSGLYRFRKPAAVTWVPYDRGYYVALPVQGFSEFWFTGDGSENPFPPADAAVQFGAARRNRSTVAYSWRSMVDSVVGDYEVQRAVNAQGGFATIRTVPARRQTVVASYSGEDQPPVASGDSVFYRLKWRQLDGTTFYSGVRRILWSDENTAVVYPNPAPDGHLRIRYTANPGTVLRVRLTDLLGRTVFSTEEIAGNWDNTLHIHQPQLRGLLLLQAELGTARFTEKVLFQ